MHAAHLMPRDPIRDLMDDGRLIDVGMQTRFYEDYKRKTNPVIQYDYEQVEP